MRPTACALLTVVVIVACGCATANAEEAGFWRWPFGRKAAAEPAAGDVSTGSVSGLQPAAPPTAANSAMVTAGAARASYAHAPLPQDSNPAVSSQHWMYETPTSKVSWPRIHMPEFSLPKPRLPRPQLWPHDAQMDQARNAWVQDSPDPSRPSPLQAVKQGAHRVGDGTRRAWHKTVDVFTPGDASGGTSSRIARRENKPPFWKRMWGSDEPKEGPRTITEWMAQERLDP
jgi:hypothetical protein